MTNDNNDVLEALETCKNVLWGLIVENGKGNIQLGDQLQHVDFAERAAAAALQPDPAEPE